MGVIFRNGIPYGGSDNSELYFSSKEDFPEEGIAENLYIAEDENKIYRWDSEGYVMVGGDTPTIEAREDGILVGDGNLWAKESPYKITQTNVGDFFVVDRDNRKNYYQLGLRNIYLSPFTSSSAKITGDGRYVADFDLEAYSFGSELKKITIKDTSNNNKETYTQDTCFKMLSTSKMFLTGNTEIVIGNQKILPFAYHAPKTELKIWDGAKILIEGIDSTESVTPGVPPYDAITSPDIHIAGSVKMTIDQGRKIPVNYIHHVYGGEQERDRIGNWTHRSTMFGPEFTIRDSPTFDISGSPFFQMHGTGMFNLETEGTCIVRDKGLVQVENNGRIYLGTNGAKDDKANPIFVMTGCGMIKAQTYSVDEGPLFLMEETGFTFNGKGYQAGSSSVSNQINDQGPLIESIQFHKEGGEILSIAESIDNVPLRENNADDLVKINKLREFFTEVDRAQYWLGRRDKFYPNYELSVCYPLKQSECGSFVYVLYRIKNEYGSKVLSHLNDGALTLYVNKKDQLFPNDYGEYWDGNGRLKVSDSLVNYEDGDAIVKIHDVDVILALISGMKSSSLKFLEFKDTDGVSYVDQIVGDFLRSYTESSKTDTVDYISAYPTGENIFPQISNASDLIGIRVSGQVSDPQAILNSHNSLTPESSFDHFFRYNYNQGNGLYFLRGKGANYSGTTDYWNSVLKLQWEDFLPTVSPQIRYYGQSRLDIGGDGGTYLRMGPKDGVIEGYILDNCKFELRNNSILDLRGPLAPPPEKEFYFDRSTDSPIFCSYGGATFLMFGNERRSSVPKAYLNKIDNSPLMAILDNSDIRFENEAKFHMNNSAKIEVLDSAEIKLSDGFYIKGGKNQDENSPNYGKYEIIFGDNEEDEQPVSFTFDELRQLKTLINS